MISIFGLRVPRVKRLRVSRMKSPRGFSYAFCVVTHSENALSVGSLLFLSALHCQYISLAYR